jgi:PAS domain S-box-containing protein
VIQALRGEQVDVPVIAGCSAVLFVLVLVRLNGLMVDIGEYRRTERQMREAEAKYRSLVEGLPAVVYIAEFGKDAAWTYISPKVESILGFTPDEWTGQADLWRERILPEDRELALGAELRILNGETRMQCEYRIIGKDGQVIWIHEEAEALADDGGRPVYLQGVMYDVTEQKNAEAQLVKALDAEKEAATRLRALHEMQNSFLQAVSHDLRTPLTSILGCALTLEGSLSQEQISREDEHDLVGRIAANARKLHRLLTNLLDLDRMSRGIVAPNRDDVDVTQILARVLQESSTDSHPMELLTIDPVLARVDAAQVERIVENLVTNAIRYTPPGTPIWVQATHDDESVLLVVEDAGPGIPEELRESIFEPFRQGDEVVRHNPGVGIGLSLVTRFAQLHGGRAWVQEREGGGSSFRVYLPFAAETDEPADEVPEPAGSRAPAAASSGGLGTPAA